MISFSKYHPPLKSAVVELLDLHWGFSDPDKSRRVFEWRYEDNPYTEAPCIYVAQDGARVIGLRCYVVQAFRRESDSLLVACPADAIVHPEYRRRGIFGELTRYSVAQQISPGVSVILSLSANRYSAAANRKSGWVQFGLARYLYRIGARGPIRSMDRSSPVDVKTGGISASIARITQLEKPPAYRYPQVTSTQLANVRDEAYYAWRYREPDARYYRVEAQGPNQAGYLVLKELGPRRFGVMEYGFDTAPVLRAMVSAFVKSVGPALVRMLDLTLSSSERRAFKEAGFFYEPAWLLRLLNKHRGSALVHVLRSDRSVRSGLQEEDVVGERNWHILSADVH